MRNHIRKCKKADKFLCTYCDKPFGNASEKQMHENENGVHLREFDSKCPLCNATVRREGMPRHFLHKHFEVCCKTGCEISCCSNKMTMVTVMLLMKRVRVKVDG